jgi:hypothetical protein
MIGDIIFIDYTPALVFLDPHFMEKCLCRKGTCANLSTPITVNQTSRLEWELCRERLRRHILAANADYVGHLHDTVLTPSVYTEDFAPMERFLIPYLNEIMTPDRPTGSLNKALKGYLTRATASSDTPFTSPHGCLLASIAAPREVLDQELIDKAIAYIRSPFPLPANTANDTLAIQVSIDWNAHASLIRRLETKGQPSYLQYALRARRFRDVLSYISDRDGIIHKRLLNHPFDLHLCNTDELSILLDNGYDIHTYIRSIGPIDTSIIEFNFTRRHNYGTCNVTEYARLKACSFCCARLQLYHLFDAGSISLMDIRILAGAQLSSFDATRVMEQTLLIERDILYNTRELLQELIRLLDHFAESRTRRHIIPKYNESRILITIIEAGFDET